MHIPRELKRQVLDHISRAERRTLEDLSTRLVQDEPAFTNRLLANIQYELDGQVIEGVQWRAKTLTSMGRGSEESRIGADFLGVLDLRINGDRIAKGFLAQAKLVKRGRTSAEEANRLSRQCELMMDVSPDSFVFSYRGRGVSVTSALSVLASSARSIGSLGAWSLKRFFAAHLDCFIGDPVLDKGSVEEFVRFASEHGIRRGIHLEGRSEGWDNDPTTVHDSPRVWYVRRRLRVQ